MAVPQGDLRYRHVWEEGRDFQPIFNEGKAASTRLAGREDFRYPEQGGLRTPMVCPNEIAR